MGQHEIPLEAGSLKRRVGWAVEHGGIVTYFRFATEDEARRFAQWNYGNAWRVIPPDDAAGVHKIGPCGCGAEHCGLEAIELNRAEGKGEAWRAGPNA